MGWSECSCLKPGKGRAHSPFLGYISKDPKAQPLNIHRTSQHCPLGRVGQGWAGQELRVGSTILDLSNENQDGVYNIKLVLLPSVALKQSQYIKQVLQALDNSQIGREGSSSGDTHVPSGS